MATSAQPGEIWQAVVRAKLQGQDCLNVLYFECVNGTNNVETELIAALITCFVTHIIPVLSSEWRLESIRAKQVAPILGPEIEGFPAEGQLQQGQGAGDGLPSFVSAHISISTVRGGRSGRGRMYLGGIREADTTLSSISIESPTWAAIAGFIGCVATKFLGGGFNANQKFSLGVMSRKLGGAKPPFSVAGFARYTGLQRHTELGTTRSRKIGHGS
jgi:hypothetical protein